MCTLSKWLLVSLPFLLGCNPSPEIKTDLSVPGFSAKGNSSSGDHQPSVEDMKESSPTRQAPNLHPVSQQKLADRNRDNKTRQVVPASSDTKGEPKKQTPRENRPTVTGQEKEEEEIADILTLEGSASTSLGSCDDGTLSGGVGLPRSGPGFIHNPRRPDNARFGTVETIHTIIHSAAVVAEKYPGSMLVLNDLSNRDGGPIRQHGSHQNGRDIDILFFYLDAKGKPIPSVGVPVDPRGWGWDFKDIKVAKDDVRVKLDTKRTWRYLHALLQHSNGLIQRIFIAEHIRSLLLKEAERVNAPRKWVVLFEQVTCQPGTPHDDHMHVRFFCTAEDISAGCEDKYPMYFWRRKALREDDVEPVMAKAKPRLRKEVKKRTTSPKEARKKAGRMHIRVRQFLDQRESWLPQPHPGRPFCR